MRAHTLRRRIPAVALAAALVMTGLVATSGTPAFADEPTTAATEQAPTSRKADVTPTGPTEAPAPAEAGSIPTPSTAGDEPVVPAPPADAKAAVSSASADPASTMRSSIERSDPLAEFTTVPKLVLSGSGLAGQWLEVEVVGGWEPVPERLQFYWYVDGVFFGNSMSQAGLIPGNDMAGRAVTARLWGDSDGFKAATTDHSNPITVTGVLDVRAAIVGTPEVGQTLEVKLTGWHADGFDASFQWQRDGEPIDGATDAAYGVTDADQGAELVVVVAGSRTHFAPLMVKSDPVRVPAAETTDPGDGDAAGIDQGANGIGPAGSGGGNGGGNGGPGLTGPVLTLPGRGVTGPGLATPGAGGVAPVADVVLPDADGEDIAPPVVEDAEYEADMGETEADEEDAVASGGPMVVVGVALALAALGALTALVVRARRVLPTP